MDWIDAMAIGLQSVLVLALVALLRRPPTGQPLQTGGKALIVIAILQTFLSAWIILDPH